MSNTKQSLNLMSKCNGTKYTKYVKLLKNLYILTALKKPEISKLPVVNFQFQFRYLLISMLNG